VDLNSNIVGARGTGRMSPSIHLGAGPEQTALMVLVMRRKDVDNRKVSSSFPLNILAAPITYRPVRSASPEDTSRRPP
jgi:hypothetical protein